MFDRPRMFKEIHHRRDSLEMLCEKLIKDLNAIKVGNYESYATIYSRLKNQLYSNQQKIKLLTTELNKLYKNCFINEIRLPNMPTNQFCKWKIYNKQGKMDDEMAEQVLYNFVNTKKRRTKRVTKVFNGTSYTIIYELHETKQSIIDVLSIYKASDHSIDNITVDAAYFENTGGQIA